MRVLDPLDGKTPFDSVRAVVRKYTALLGADVLAAIVDTIGNTPLVEVSQLSPTAAVRIFAILEGQNPGGSSKDRIALAMGEQAEREGRLHPGSTILEPSSGNTGIGHGVVPFWVSENRVSCVEYFCGA